MYICMYVCVCVYTAMHNVYRYTYCLYVHIFSYSCPRCNSYSIGDFLPVTVGPTQVGWASHDFVTQLAPFMGRMCDYTTLEAPISGDFGVSSPPSVSSSSSAGAGGAPPFGSGSQLAVELAPLANRCVCVIVCV